MDACPEAFYHAAQRSCERCSDHCRLCSGAGRCLRCDPSYYVSDGACAKLECGEGNPGSNRWRRREAFPPLLTFAFLSYGFAPQERWRTPTMMTAWPVRRAAGSASCVSHSSVTRISSR